MRACITSGLSVAAFLLLVSSRASAVELAKSADAFVDSIGVCTHYSVSTNEVYQKPYADQVLFDLGVRYIRGGFPNSQSEVDRIQTFYNDHGIRLLLAAADPNWLVSELTDGIPGIPGSGVNNSDAYLGIEGYNEPDLRNPPYSYAAMDGVTYTDDPPNQTYAGTRAFQGDVGATITEGKVLATPAVGYTTEAQYIPPIPYNVRTLHAYTYNHAPAVPLSRLDQKIADVDNVYGVDTPLWITEAGFNTAYETPFGHKGAWPVTTAGQAKYLPRQLTENFNRDVERTFLYELLDEGQTLDEPEDNFGLAYYDGSPKPAYRAVQHLIQLLGDPGETFTPDTLDFAITGAPASLHHTLLQKRDGDFYLMLWNEVESVDPRDANSGPTDLAVAPVSVTLDFGKLVQSIDVYTGLSEEDYTTSQHVNLSSLSIAVPDEVIIARINADLALGDFNGNGAPDLDDYFTLVGNLHKDLTGLFEQQTYELGDINGDLAINYKDFVEFREAYPNLQRDLVALRVPEASTCELVLFLSAVLGVWRIAFGRQPLTLRGCSQEV